MNINLIDFYMGLPRFLQDMPITIWSKHHNILYADYGVLPICDGKELDVSEVLEYYVKDGHAIIVVDL